MGIFVILFLYLLFLKFVVKDANKKNRLLFSVFAGFGLWIVLALRSPYCGVDLLSGLDGSSNYYNMFVRASDHSLWEIIRGDLTYYSNMETGWLIYCKAVSFLTTNFQIFIAITALVEISLIGFVLYKYSEDLFLSYIVFFCFGLYILSFSALRQVVAFSLTFISFHYLIQKKYIKYAIALFFATSLHTSALFFILAYPLKKILFSAKKSLLLVLCVFLLLPLLSTIVSTIVPVLFQGRYLNYLDQGGAITLFLLYVVIFLLSLKMKVKTEYDNLLRGLIFMAIVCQSLGYIGAGPITRIGFYFTIFFTLLFPKLVREYSTKKEKTIITVLGSVFFFIYFWWANKDGYLNVIPYSFFWEKPFIY